MNASRFISRKIKFGGTVATISVAISFFIIIISVSISSGFRKELRKGISNLSGDIQLVSPTMNYVGETDYISLNDSTVSKLLKIPGIESLSPVIYRAGIIKNDENISGVLFKGTEDFDSLRVSIPSKLASTLGLEVGDYITTYFVGERVNARKFEISDIYTSVITGDDNMVVFAGLSDIQRLNRWDDGMVSAYEVILDEAHSSPEQISEINETVGTIVLEDTPEDESAPVAISALHRFPQIFSWLELIDMNVVLVLVLMTIVAGFNMISGLLILLFRNISTIGTLKSLGMKDRNISEIFFRVATHIVFKGMLAGNILALLFCFVQHHTRLITLNPENYFLSYVPVNVNLWMILLADLVSYLVIVLLLLIPSFFVSKVDPAKTVRAQ